MSNNGNNSNGPSWVAIILWLIFFWPVGLYLLIKKFSTDKKAAISTGGKGMKAIGIVLIVFGAIALLGSLSDFDFGVVIVSLFFIIGGVALMKKAKKIKEEAESTKQYIAIVVNGQVRQLDAIASATGKSYDTVHKDIQNMIDKGYLKNAYIDEGNRAVVLPDSNFAPQSNVATATVTTPATAQPKVIACPCCGANNTITGNTGECEYCGTPLK